ncbi:hypothetical protein [Proteus sp. CD3]|uniref:hypothetical protein n=1 Tax=Proteus sp. CD3 TaxID=1921565 RepID=UPI00124A0568|nr:hypothetical protein [Proteus sp. CD3]QEZ93105.1 hypothetical protein BTA34_12510 [Proteus sp. CD3]
MEDKYMAGECSSCRSALDEKKEEYKQNQITRMNNYVVGNKDFMGNTISRIYARGDQYLVYTIEGSSDITSLKVIVDTLVEDDFEPMLNFQCVKDDFDKLKSTLYKLGVDESYKQRASSAIVTAILGDTENSKTIIANITKDAECDYKTKIYSRLFYLLGAAIVAICFSISSVIFYFLREKDFIITNATFFNMLYCLTYSTLGGFLSVSLKAKYVSTQQAISNWMYSIYGAERLVISLIAGVVIYSLVRSGLMFSGLISNDGNMFMLLMLSFVSGFSETLIPNSLSKIESNYQQ